MSINKGKGGGGRRGVRDVLISPFSKVFDYIREKFEAAMAQRGGRSLMPPEAYKDPSYEWAYAES